VSSTFFFNNLVEAFLDDHLVYVPLSSFDFILRFVYPHFLHLVARTELRALHFMHIFICKSTFSASGNLAMIHLW
jgi:hypothetical protein